MRTYKGTRIKVGDPDGCRIALMVEMWREGNTGEVYSENDCLYHGFIGEALKAYNSEVQRLIGIAEKYGFKYEVTERHA